MTAAAVICAALAGVVLAGRPSLLWTRLGRRSGGGEAVFTRYLAGRIRAQRRGYGGAGQGRSDRKVPGDLAATTSTAGVGPRERSGPLRRARARMSAGRNGNDRESDIAEICLALSAELRSGLPMGAAVAAVAADWPDLLGDVAGQSAIGGDVAAALRRAGRPDGASALNAVAAAWEVAERTGAPLSRVLLAVADSLRMAAAARREAHSQLATARSTARLMAILPFGTLVMLSGGEQAAIRFLVTTPVGLVCLGVAAVLAGLGLWWVGRVSRTATGTVWTP